MKKIIIIILSFPITLALYILLFGGDIKYSEEIIINANIDKVKFLFENPYNMTKYIGSIESYKLISGDIMKIGAKAEITYVIGENKIIMSEEIISNNLPAEKKVIYTANGINNIVTNRLVMISDAETKLIKDHEYKFTGYLKIISFFMSSAFKQQSRDYLISFKDFVEKS